MRAIDPHRAAMRIVAQHTLVILVKLDEFNQPLIFMLDDGKV